MMRIRLLRFALASFFLIASTTVPAQARANACAPDPVEQALAQLSGAVREAGSHRVPTAVQDAVLEGLIEKVRGRMIERRTDPTLPRYVIQIDLDNTVFIPRAGTIAALKAVGEKYDISEFEDPASLAVLPAYKTEAFERFLEELGVRERYPDVDWDHLYKDFNRVSWAHMDESSEDITPGFARFTRRVKNAGGRIVYNTGRREYMREVTMEGLTRAGIRHPYLIMKQASGDTAEAKAAVQPMIREKYGETIAIIDDIHSNLDAVGEAVGPDVIRIPIAVPGFNTEISWDEFDDHPYRLSTFETTR